MILAHKIALDPTMKQRRYFERAAGCDRFVWNLALEMWNAEYAAGRSPNVLLLHKRFNAVKYQQYPWMKDIHRDAHARPFLRLGAAWMTYFKALKRGDRRVQKPHFYKKARKDSFYVANDQIIVNHERIRLPIIGWIRMRETLRFTGKIMGVVVSRTADRWFVSVQVEIPDKQAKRARTGDGVAGVDWGVKNALTVTREADGKTATETVLAPKPLKKALRKLRRMQRRVAARKKGGENRRKLVRRIARVHARVAYIRGNFWHQQTARLCRENQAVGIEDLNATGMAQNRRLSRAVADVGCYELRRQLEYKAKLYGTRLVIADRWYPSSKTCSRCGHVVESLPLAERTFRCDWCGHVQDRDVNASRNLCALAKQFIPAACGEITPGDSERCRAAG